MRWTAEQVAAATGGVAFGGGAAGEGVITDSRGAVAGAWFLALTGPNFDGHAFAAAAVRAGAVGAVLRRQPEGFDGPWVEVADTTQALQDLGRAARARMTCPVVGLTGSSGKTTTRGLIAAALAQLGPVHQTVGNLNNHLGVPLTLVAAPEDAQAVVVEMGTSGPGEIRFLAELARPTARLVVNVGPAHLEELGGLDGVAVEKGAIYDTAGPDDLLVVNLDDPRLAPWCQRAGGRRVVTWGRHADADVRLVEVAVDADTLGTRALMHTPVGPLKVSLAAPGAHVAHNAAGALAMAWGLGLDLARAADDLAAFRTIGMRLRAQPLAGGVVLINDAYNANPASVKAAVDLMASLPGRRVVVLGDMLELGPDELRWHAEVADYADASGVDRVLVAGARMAAVRPGAPVDPTELVDEIVGWLQPGDRVLVKGSRGARMERFAEALGQALEVVCSTT